jgi:DNA primase
MSVIEEIKQKLDIVEIINSYTNLQKSGRNFRALCPFHSEKTPSFFVFPERQSWHCFGACGTGGDIFSFIMKKEGLDFGQSLRLLAEKAGVILISLDHKAKEDDQNKERLLDYLAYRGISEQIIISFQLGFSPDSYDETRQYLLSKGFKENEICDAGLLLERDNGTYYDRFRNRLMFPIRNIKGNIIGFGARALDNTLPKYLNSPQTAIFDKGSSLYAIDKAKEAIRKRDFVTIMEGYMDVITAHQYGYDNSVASMGTALGEKQLASLKNFTRNIMIALDADSAGEEAEMRIAETINIEEIFQLDDFEKILDVDVKIVIPSEGKDPDEEIRKDTKLWQKSLEKAKPIMEFVFDMAKAKIKSGTSKNKTLVAERLLQLIAKIERPVLRGHYVQEVARILKMRPSELIDQVNKIRRNSKKRITKDTVDTGSKGHLVSYSCPIEGYCLSLLIRCPELRGECLDLSQDYFEHDESKEIFLKWQQSNDQASLRNNLDVVLHPYFDELLSWPFPPAIIESEERRRRDFTECVIRLREKLLKNLAARKAEILAAEAETGAKDADITKLEEQGIEESIKLKQNFAAQNRRNRSIV